MKQLLLLLAVLCCVAGCQAAPFDPPRFSTAQAMPPAPSRVAQRAPLPVKPNSRAGGTLQEQIAALRSAPPASQSPAEQPRSAVQLTSLNQPAPLATDRDSRLPLRFPPILSAPAIRLKADASESEKPPAPETRAPETREEETLAPETRAAENGEGNDDDTEEDDLPSGELQPTIVEAIPAPVNPQPTYDLATIEHMALRNNPTFAQHATRVQALHGKWVQAGLGPNPTVGYAAEDIGETGGAGRHGAFVSQQFVLGNKLELNRAIASREIIQAQNQLAAQRRRILTDVRIGYYNVLIAQRKYRISKELVVTGEKSVNVAKELFKAKEINRVPVLQAQLETGNLRLLAAQAANETEAAWRELESVAGAPDLERVDLQGGIEENPAQIVFGDSLGNILANSPQLAAAVADVDRARASYNRAVVEPVPNITGQLTVQQDTASDSTVVGVQIGLPLPVFNKNQGQINQTCNEIAVAQRNVARLQLTLKQRLATVFRDYTNAQIQADKYANEILPRAKETLELVTQGYAAGETSYLTLLTTQRTFFQTKLAQIEAQRTLWTTTAEIQGLLLRNSLQQQVSARN